MINFDWDNLKKLDWWKDFLNKLYENSKFQMIQTVIIMYLLFVMFVSGLNHGLAIESWKYQINQLVAARESEHVEWHNCETSRVKLVSDIWTLNNKIEELNAQISDKDQTINTLTDEVNQLTEALNKKNSLRRRVR